MEKKEVMKKPNNKNSLITIIISVFAGALLMYGVFYFFPITYKLVSFDIWVISMILKFDKCSILKKIFSICLGYFE